MQAWDLPFQSYDAKGNFVTHDFVTTRHKLNKLISVLTAPQSQKAKEICPLVQLLIAADGLASQVLEGKK